MTFVCAFMSKEMVVCKPRTDWNEVVINVMNNEGDNGVIDENNVNVRVNVDTDSSNCGCESCDCNEMTAEFKGKPCL